jgi:hypothetical protein
MGDNAESGTVEGWTIEKLLQLRDSKIEEHAELEYKAGAALAKDGNSIEEFTKDVPAMANANGGTIIYGLKEERTSKRGPAFPIALDPVDETVFNREWVDQMLGQIRPALRVRIETLRIEGPQPKAIHILHVPKGYTAHQAKDGKYYRRRNVTIDWMPDYELREVMNRAIIPVVSTAVEISMADDGSSLLRCTVKNEGEGLVLHLGCDIQIPIKLGSFVVTFEPHEGGRPELWDSHWNLRFRNLQTGPLFPAGSIRFESRFRQGRPLMVSGLTFAPSYVISATTYADNMPPRRAEFDAQSILSRVPIPTLAVST